MNNWRMLIAGLACIGTIAIGGPVAAEFRDVTDESFIPLREGVLATMRGNRTQLQWAFIKWARTTSEDNFVSGRTAHTGGVYSMWISEEKVATSSLEENFVHEPGQPKGSIERTGIRAAFDGKQYRVVPNIDSPKDIAITSEPRFSGQQHFLKVVHWPHEEIFEAVTSGSLEGVKVSWDLRDEAETRILIVNAVNPGHGSCEYHYDLSQGANVVSEVAHSGKGLLLYRTSWKYAHLGGIWFPISMSTRAYDESGQKVTLQQQFSVDLEHTVINDPSKVPDQVFDISTTPEMEISDYRGGFRIDYPADIADDIDEVFASVSDLDARMSSPSALGREPTAGLSPSPPTAATSSRAKPLRWIFVGGGIVLLVLGVVGYSWGRWRKYVNAEKHFQE